MISWEERVSISNDYIAGYDYFNNTRFFKLTVEEITHTLLKDLYIKGYGYNGRTPGPVIIVKQGEWVELTVENRLNEPTAVHVHGLAKPNSQDGAPDIEPTPLIMPGGSYRYKFFAWQSGSFFYHSIQGFQSNLGLLGPFIVLPETPIQVPDHDFILVLQEWEVPQPEKGKVFHGTYRPDKFAQRPNFFTINGKAFPTTSPFYVNEGEMNRFRFINKSNDSHSMHLHGHDFRVVAVDGFPRSVMDDTINIASGTRWEVDVLMNNPGIWPLNATKTFHGSNNGETPGGMLTRVIYK